MITPAYCATMVRYNAWQNNQLKPLLTALPEAELTRDRGAFFGSIFETANHLLWGDLMWMHRLDGGAEPPVDAAEHRRLTKNLAEWIGLRDAADERISIWFNAIRPEQLAGDLRWHSKISGTDKVTPMAQCVMHLFNHQTHHRGQIHAMLTAAGSEAPVSDLALMPEEP